MKVSPNATVSFFYRSPLRKLKTDGDKVAIHGLSGRASNRKWSEKKSERDRKAKGDKAKGDKAKKGRKEKEEKGDRREKGDCLCP